MAERKPFLLRLDPRTMEALRGWASDDLRSLNGQIEFLLRRALRDAGRMPLKSGDRGAAVAGEQNSRGGGAAAGASPARGER